MKAKYFALVSIPVAILSWWALYQLTTHVQPGQPRALLAFYGLVFVGSTATLAPIAAYLNRRLAPEGAARAPWRFLRQSVLAGCCGSLWLWLQMHRAFNLGFAFVSALIFITIELLVARMRGEATPPPGDKMPDDDS